jgi:hypothetical protein
MGTCWTLYVVPKSESFVPSKAQVKTLLPFLAARTGVASGYEVGARTGLSAVEAADAFAEVAAEAGTCIVEFTDDLKSDVLFGWDPDAGDDERFWADGLLIETTEEPSECGDDEGGGPVASSRFSIAFTGNKGWYGEVGTVFQDKTFLSDLEKVLGIPLDVIAVSS